MSEDIPKATVHKPDHKPEPSADKQPVEAAPESVELTAQVIGSVSMLS